MKSLYYIIPIALLLIFAGYMANQKDNSLKKIEKSETLTIGVSIDDFPPLYYINENNEIDGFEIELIREFARRMGVNIFVKYYPWDELIELAQKNEFDLTIASFTITPKRQKKVLFSNPYLHTGQVIITRVDDNRINSELDLADAKVGYFKGTTQEDILLRYAKRENMIEYSGESRVIEALVDGEIDAMLEDYVLSAEQIKKYPEVRTIGTKLISEESYGIIANKESIKLIEKINEILKEITRDGTMKRLKDKWKI